MYNRSIYDEFITFAFNVRMKNSLTLVLSFDRKKSVTITTMDQIKEKG